MAQEIEGRLGRGAVLLGAVPPTSPAWERLIGTVSLPTPPCPFTAASLLGLRATVLLLITLLIKDRIQIKLASALGLFLLALQTLLYLAAAGALGLRPRLSSGGPSTTTLFISKTLKIKGIEFVYPGTTRLRIGADGTIVEHRDYFDFVGPTFAPVPVVGGFVRWLYRRFVS